MQCSLYGKDPYWGRVLSELGASGAWFDPERVDIAYNGVTVCRNGVAALHDETALEQVMDQLGVKAGRHVRVGGEAELHVEGGPDGRVRRGRHEGVDDRLRIAADDVGPCQALVIYQQQLAAPEQ